MFFAVGLYGFDTRGCLANWVNEVMKTGRAIRDVVFVVGVGCVRWGIFK